MADQRRVSEAAIRTWISQALVVHPRLYPRRIFGSFLCGQKGTLRQAKSGIPEAGAAPLGRRSLKIPYFAVDKGGKFSYNTTVNAITMALKASWMEPDASEGGKYRCLKFMSARASLWRTP